MMFRCLVSAMVLTFLAAAPVKADRVAEAVRILQSVESGGKGTADAREAIAVLNKAGSTALMPVLKGFNNSSPLAENWLRNAFELIAEDTQTAGKELPERELETFIRDRDESATARRLVYETLKAKDPEIESRLIPDMLLDPSPEFRRDAVARLIDQASAAADTSESITLYRRAMQGAVHEDQVQKISEALRKNGEKIDIQKHFGFLTRWSVVGPFDNSNEKGFAVAFTPETEATTGTRPDPASAYDGQSGRVQWTPLTTDDDYGVIDIAKQLENYKGSLMYATTSWTSPADQQVEIRLGTPNAWKLWINGKLIFEREEYHRSSQMDQYRVPVTLKAGENSLLLKVCQNEQSDDWAQRYQFQLRICDSTGSAVPSGDTTARSDVQQGVSR